MKIDLERLAGAQRAFSRAQRNPNDMSKSQQSRQLRVQIDMPRASKARGCQKDEHLETDIAIAEQAANQALQANRALSAAQEPPRTMEEDRAQQLEDRRRARS